jgi:hypothetical protein
MSEVVMLSAAKHPVETPQSFSNWITARNWELGPFEQQAEGEEPQTLRGACP